MKTLTVTISDEAAAKLAAHAIENRRTTEEWAARLMEEAYGGDWLDELTVEDRAAIAEGLAQVARGETTPQDEVFSALDRKYGW